MRRLKVDPILGFLIAAIALISIYTVSPESWVSDRSTLIVAMSLLLLLHHFIVTEAKGTRISILYVCLLSLIAMGSKESGLIVPLFVFLASIFGLPPANRSRKQVIVVSLALVCLYVLLRLVIFNTAAASFSESGYIFGVRPYDDWASLPIHLRLWALVENSIKNTVAIAIPVFNDQGGLQISNPLIWIPTAVLFIAALSRQMTVAQKYAAIIHLLNAAIHCLIFRHRVQYISMFAFCLLVGASSAIQEGATRAFYARVAASLLLVGSILHVNVYLQQKWYSRYEQVNKFGLGQIIEKYPDKIDPKIVSQVLTRYRQRESANETGNTRNDGVK